MNKSEISKNYNIDKIVTAKELASLSRTYKDNLQTIIVMMKRKEKNTQPPQWFVDYMDSFRKEIDQKFKDFAKLNNLKCK
ncbi:MAG: hypothetical protein ACOQNY_01395 [Mycoplasmoidaceae bacterium]